MTRFLTNDEWRREFAVLNEDERRRRTALLERFRKEFPPERSVGLFSAPGRTELGGNHTDHENGKVLAAAVDLDTIAAASENGTNLVRLHSEGYRPCEVDLSDLSPAPGEKNTTNALIRGVAARFCQLGAEVRGVDIAVTSQVLSGSGLSSSAALEVLLGVIFNTLFFGGKATPVEIAQIGQYAENVYFGKPSGLMDQMASSVGGAVYIDFRDPKTPEIEPIAFDLAATGHALCILDSGASHAALTGEYAAIVSELRAVCAFFGKTTLREVNEDAFFGALGDVRRRAGDRAALRAMHIFAENKRVTEQASALKNGDFDRFLALVGESGRSSWLYLQNILPTGATAHQEVALALALCGKLLGGRGACRVHGGGFAGTVQAFVPTDLLPHFCAESEKVLGAGACRVLSIRPQGGIQL